MKVAQESAGGCGPVRVDSKVFHSATVPTLVGISKEAAMVVVGYRGRGGALVRKFLGSVSSGLVYHAHCPVAVIHDVGIRRRIEIGDPARPLIEASERAQLLVVGSHGRGKCAGTLLGSVGAAAVNSAKIPVIVARQP